PCNSGSGRWASGLAIDSRHEQSAKATRRRGEDTEGQVRSKHGYGTWGAKCRAQAPEAAAGGMVAWEGSPAMSHARSQTQSNACGGVEVDDAVTNPCSGDGERTETTGGSVAATQVTVKREVPILTFAADGLPTAAETVGGEETELTVGTRASTRSWDTGSRDLANVCACYRPSGRPLAVEGAFGFRCRAVYNQTILVDALTIEGYVDEFILGLDFLRKTGAIINHATCKVTYGDDGEATLPFAYRDVATRQNQPAAVRLLRCLRVGCEQRASMRARVSAQNVVEASAATGGADSGDGAWRHVMIPMLNTQGGRAKLPPRHLLGMWQPLDATMEAIDVAGGLDRDSVEAWVGAIGGEEVAPRPEEGELNTGGLEGGDEELMLRLLRCYPRLLKRHEECPPPVTTGVRHAIKTGAAPPISLRRHLSAVLERLDQAGMTLKASKCTFGAQNIEYLGHHLGPDGVRLLQRLVSAIEQFPMPQDPVALKRFVHLAEYYHKFVPHFGTLAAPLTRLLKKDSVWQWGDDEARTYAALTTALVTKPVLQYPDFARPFVLSTNASTVGLDAALM
ncbi:hypothetical protein PybrP1_010742, partial [[Pythium] brassicae (nom. inval.)]